MHTDHSPEPPFPRIVRSRDVLYGKPRIDGTRWPTEIAVSFGFDPVAIREQYPHLRIDQIMSAILYERSWHRRLRRWLLRAMTPVFLWMRGSDER